MAVRRVLRHLVRCRSPGTGCCGHGPEDQTCKVNAHVGAHAEVRSFGLSVHGELEDVDRDAQGFFASGKL